MDDFKPTIEIEGEANAAAKAAPSPTAPKAAPAATVIDGRNASIVDARGRLIKVKRLNALDRMRVFRVLGSADSTNAQVVAYGILAASAKEIDGVAMPFPTSALILETHVQSLDDEGLDAVAKALAAITPDEKEVAAAAQNL